MIISKTGIFLFVYILPVILLITYSNSLPLVVVENFIGTRESQARQIPVPTKCKCATDLPNETTTPRERLSERLFVSSNREIEQGIDTEDRLGF